MAVKKKAIKKGKVTVKKSKKTVRKASKPAAKKATTKAKKTPTKKVVSKKKKTVLVKKTAPKKLLKKVVKPAKKVVVKKAAPKKVEKVVLPKPVKEPKIVIPHTPPQVVYPDKNALKTRVRTLLISQPKPESEKNPYLELARRLNIKVDFRHFIKIEGITSKEFRQQRINLTEHNAVILTSRNAVDHFFRVCGEMRYNVPETTKYFCLNEATAYYLQKYIQYRKRKIFFGNGTISDLAESLRKNKEEHFLLPVADVHREEKIIDVLDLLKLRYKKAVIYRTISADLSDLRGTLNYDVLVFFTPAGIKSLAKNFPNFKQGEIRIAAFGAATAEALRAQKLRIDIASPNPQTPSMVMALENYIRDVNKR
ncbi:MAG TPA: uroporphyrinogen-III synthase [Bacteroidia bacterium]|jgi:uroporphyrinogen-III synthase|nr:uroporphyrinogen-III synthase [Bacteroidia bacterium]